MDSSLHVDIARPSTVTQPLRPRPWIDFREFEHRESVRTVRENFQDTAFSATVHRTVWCKPTKSGNVQIRSSVIPVPPDRDNEEVQIYTRTPSHDFIATTTNGCCHISTITIGRGRATAWHVRKKGDDPKKTTDSSIPSREITRRTREDDRVTEPSVEPAVGVPIGCIDSNLAAQEVSVGTFDFEETALKEVDLSRNHTQLETQRSSDDTVAHVATQTSDNISRGGTEEVQISRETPTSEDLNNNLSEGTQETATERETQADYCDPTPAGGLRFSTAVQDSNESSVSASCESSVAATCETPAPGSYVGPVFMERQHNVHRERRRRMKEKRQRRACRDSADEYKMTARPRGRCVIINNEAFNAETDRLEWRHGSEVDKENLKTTFESLELEVLCFDNLTDIEMVRRLKDESSIDHETYDIFVCCILSHGHLGTVFGTNGRSVEISDITKLFRSQFCGSLAGKPKIFIIQACQGDDEQRGCPERLMRQDAGPENTKRLLPCEADFLMCYATAPGYIAYRDPERGSPYIRILTEQLRQHSDTHHFADILTKVNRKMGDEDFLSPSCGTSCKQSPAHSSTLRKSIYFNNSSIY